MVTIRILISQRLEKGLAELREGRVVAARNLHEEKEHASASGVHFRAAPIVSRDAEGAAGYSAGPVAQLATEQEKEESPAETVILPDAPVIEDQVEADASAAFPATQQ